MTDGITNRCIIDAILVDVLQKVNSDQYGYKSEVDLSQHALGLCRIDGLIGMLFVYFVVVVEIRRMRGRRGRIRSSLNRVFSAVPDVGLVRHGRGGCIRFDLS